VYLRREVRYNPKYELLAKNTLKSLVTLCGGKGGMELLHWLPDEFLWEICGRANMHRARYRGEIGLVDFFICSDILHMG